MCGDFITAFHHLKEAYREVREELFIRNHSDRDRSRGNGFKLTVSRFR